MSSLFYVIIISPPHGQSQVVLGEFVSILGRLDAVVQGNYCGWDYFLVKRIIPLEGVSGHDVTTHK